MFTTINRGKSSSVIIFLQVFLFFANAEPASWIDSVEYRYSFAAEKYDGALLEKIARFITRQPDGEQRKPQALLLLGLIYWRMELIAYCSNASALIKKNGKLAVEKLHEAERAGADVYLTAGHKALASQLLAGLSISSGAMYGPRIATELKKAQKANPTGYYSLLVEAINVNQAPSFVGGSPKKAVVLLEKMALDFPDSIDVKIHLSEAYGKVGRFNEAMEVIKPIIKAHPDNLLARKIAAELLSK